MSSSSSDFVSGPVKFVINALKDVDKQLENVSLAADALQRGRSPLPPVTSDFNEDEKESLVSKAITAVRQQVQRGSPIDAPPEKAVVSTTYYRARVYQDGDCVYV